MGEETIGVLGGTWRGSVTPWGAIQQWAGPDVLEWHVAADDRWHTPSAEPTVRQTRLDGTPVIETRLRVPQGDVVHRAYAVADHGGITLVEIENDSPLPVAVAFSGCAVMSVRPPADVPIQGIQLPSDAAVFPVGHHATLTVGLSHHGVSRQLPSNLSSAAQVARGWSAMCDRASRLDLPDPLAVHAVIAQRCELSLTGPPLPADDPVEFLLAVRQLVRMAGQAESWMPDVADAVAALARNAQSAGLTAEDRVALSAAAAIAQHARDRRASRDLEKVRARLADRAPNASTDPNRSMEWLPEPAGLTGARFLAATERRLAAGGDLLPVGMPAAWLGQNFEVHGVPTIGRSTVSFAVRWHGDRPAVLWECSGDPVTLTSSRLAPGWSTDQATGEALWPAPPAELRLDSVAASLDQSISFS